MLLELELDFSEEDVEFADRTQLRTDTDAIGEITSEITSDEILQSVFSNLLHRKVIFLQRKAYYLQIQLVNHIISSIYN